MGSSSKILGRHRLAKPSQAPNVQLWPNLGEPHEIEKVKMLPAQSGGGWRACGIRQTLPQDRWKGHISFVQ